MVQKRKLKRNKDTEKTKRTRNKKEINEKQFKSRGIRKRIKEINILL
jgi:hypothetical protein